MELNKGDADEKEEEFRNKKHCVSVAVSCHCIFSGSSIYAVQIWDDTKQKHQQENGK